MACRRDKSFTCARKAVYDIKHRKQVTISGYRFGKGGARRQIFRHKTSDLRGKQVVRLFVIGFEE